jgi:5'-nucleotidase
VNILLTNDDGILAPGLAAMHRELVAVGEVSVVAPASPQSAAAHGITVGGPIAVRQVHVAEQFVGFAVEGRPADCVKLALSTLLDRRPDLVVSGINDGANVSINVLYSGTVAAAAEGALLGIPSVAVSLERGEEMDFERAAKIARTVIDRLNSVAGPDVPLINVNIPALRPGVPKGVRVVRQSTQLMQDRYIRHAGPDGRLYFWLEGEFEEATHQADTDLEALREGYVTLTPLHFDLTREDQLRRMCGRPWG